MYTAVIIVRHIKTFVSYTRRPVIIVVIKTFVSYTRRPVIVVVWLESRQVEMTH